MRYCKSLVARMTLAGLLSASSTVLAGPSFAPVSTWSGAPSPAASAPAALPAAPVPVVTNLPLPAPGCPTCSPPACAAEPACCNHAPSCCSVYGGVEALFWWVKNPSVVPLVSTNDDPNTIAALNEPGTRVLFGGQGNPIDFGNMLGVRGRIGFLLPDEVAGVEASLFGLPRQGTTFVVNAAGGNGPVIAIPFNSTVPFNFNPAGETSLNPGNVPSQITVNATTQLWGADVLGLARLYSSDRVRLMAVGGFKYLDLEEALTLSQLFLDPLVPGTQTVRDSFFTRNQFYGLSVGLQGGFRYDFVSLDVCGKVAVGPTHQQLRVAGETTNVGGAFGGLPGVTPAGVFAQPSNSGEFNRNTFTVVPELAVRLNCDVTRSLRLTVGYDVLYSNNVIRAATQIDRNVNPTQNVAFLTPVGLTAPLPTFTRTDFWAQGISAGVQFQY